MHSKCDHGPALILTSVRSVRISLVLDAIRDLGPASFKAGRRRQRVSLWIHGEGSCGRALRTGGDMQENIELAEHGLIPPAVVVAAFVILHREIAVASRLRRFQRALIGSVQGGDPPL